MRSVTATDEPERRLAEALQARATGGRPGRAEPPCRRAALPCASGTSTRRRCCSRCSGAPSLGTALALLSLLAPGVLPPLG